MSLSAYSKSDGRMLRGRRAMRKLVRLGLSKDEIVELHNRVRERRLEPVASSDEVGSLGRDERLQAAQAAIRTLITLGFAECDIAELSGLSTSTITRVLDPYEARIVAPETVIRLQQVLQRAGLERLKKLIPGLQVEILETCCDKGHAVDTAGRAVLEESVRDVLIGVLAQADPPERLASGIVGALVQLGEPADGITVMLAPCGGAKSPERRLARLKALEHESAHLHQRYREERSRLELALRPSARPAPPRDGSIA